MLQNNLISIDPDGVFFLKLLGHSGTYYNLQTYKSIPSGLCVRNCVAQFRPF